MRHTGTSQGLTTPTPTLVWLSSFPHTQLVPIQTPPQWRSKIFHRSLRITISEETSNFTYSCRSQNTWLQNFSPSLLYLSYPPQNTPLSSLHPQQHYAMHQTPHATMRLQGLCGSLWRSLKLKQIHTFNFHISLVILLSVCHTVLMMLVQRIWH